MDDCQWPQRKGWWQTVETTWSCENCWKYNWPMKFVHIHIQVLNEGSGVCSGESRRLCLVVYKVLAGQSAWVELYCRVPVAKHTVCHALEKSCIMMMTSFIASNLILTLFEQKNPFWKAYSKRSWRVLKSWLCRWCYAASSPHWGVGSVYLLFRHLLRWGSFQFLLWEFHQTSEDHFLLWATCQLRIMWEEEGRLQLLILLENHSLFSGLFS